MTDQKQDVEISAMQQVLDALASLDMETQNRVIVWICAKLGLAKTVEDTSTAMPQALVPQVQKISKGMVSDIKTLKEEKAPNSANQMAALVAYYLMECVPAEERKEVVNTEDIVKYFKQAGFPLPEKPAATLQNAKNAGYFDAAGSGLYKLNPVGYNLIAYKLPGQSNSAVKRKRTHATRQESKNPKPAPKG